MGATGLNELSPWIWRGRLEFEPNHSYWARSAGPRNPRLASDLDVDVAIVGGGFTGLSSAYYIRGLSAQKSVAVLEAQGCGSGASGRNGAMVLTMTADRFMNFSSSPAMDRQIYDLTVDNIRRLAALSAATGIDCELTTNGALQVLGSAQETKAAEAYVRQARSLGMPVEFWDAEQVAAAIGTKVYEGGFFDPRCGNVHPMKLVRVFKAAAMSAGAAVYEDTVVESIEEGRQHVLHTREGRTVRAKSLVLASNAFTSRLGFFRNSILPLRECIGITRPFSEQELADIGWRRPVPFNDDRTQVYYLGVTADRRIHIARLGMLVLGMCFALYLISAELLIIGAICLWCTGVHVVTFALFILVVQTVPRMLGWGQREAVPVGGPPPRRHSTNSGNEPLPGNRLPRSARH